MLLVTSFLSLYVPVYKISILLCSSSSEQMKPEKEKVVKASDYFGEAEWKSGDEC